MNQSRNPATLTFTAVGKTAPPSNITNLTYEPISDKEIRLRWDAVTDQDVRARRPYSYTAHT